MGRNIARIGELRHAQFQSDSCKRGEDLETLGVEGKITLKLMSVECGVKV
jgi:hypothetical protein